jgi:hypothetical protein
MKDPLLSRYLTYFLFLQILCVQIVSNQTDFIEKYYAHIWYPFIATFFRKSIGWIPFSVGDLLYISFGILSLRFLYIGIRDKFGDLRKYIFSIGAALSVLYFLFYANWGLHYFRKPLTAQLGMTNKNYEAKILEKYTENLIFELNKTHFEITNNRLKKLEIPYTRKEIYTLSVKAYQILEKEVPFFDYKIPSIKHSLLSTPLTYMGFSGYFNPFTGEAQVNSKTPLSSYAFSTCHEMAHQIGYAAENEANFIAYLATTHSKNPYFIYTGKLTALKYMLSEVSKRAPVSYQNLLKKMHPGILEDMKASRDFWKSHQNPLEPYFKKIYGTFLKANQQKGGIQSYSYMVRLLLNYAENDFKIIAQQKP